MYSEKTKIYFTILGVYFGYPDCCIEWFINRTHLGIDTYQDRVHNGMGFVPCPKCAKKLALTLKPTSSLIKNRIEILPFPHTSLFP